MNASFRRKSYQACFLEAQVEASHSHMLSQTKWPCHMGAHVVRTFPSSKVTIYKGETTPVSAGQSSSASLDRDGAYIHYNQHGYIEYVSFYRPAITACDLAVFVAQIVNLCFTGDRTSSLRM